MSLVRMMTAPVTVLHGVTTTDRYGDTLDLDWSAPDEVDADTDGNPLTCWHTAVSTDEVIDGRDAVVSRWHFSGFAAGGRLVPDIAFAATDRVRIAGVVYAVDGAVTAADRPGKGTHHVECRLLLVEG